MLERAARGSAAAPSWVENLPMGSHSVEGRARRGGPVSPAVRCGARRTGGLVCERPSSAPRVITVPQWS